MRKRKRPNINKYKQSKTQKLKKTNKNKVKVNGLSQQGGGVVVLDSNYSGGTYVHTTFDAIVYGEVQVQKKNK